MATHPLWTDEYWLLLMQLYLRKPEGVKPVYSRQLVELALELHIPPQFLNQQMFRLRTIDTPRIQRLWDTYGQNPKKLARGVKLLRQKVGYGNASLFYDGVDVNETWEKDFKPIELPTVGGRGQESYAQLTPVALILILDLYFRLTPITMVVGTPEVMELAKLLKTSAKLVVEVMEIYQFCDPYLNRSDFLTSPLLNSCQQVWQRFGNDNPQKLAAFAAQLKEYYKS